MKGLIYLCLVLVYLVTACNPSRRICMKNSSADTAEFLWKASEDSIGFNPFVLNNSRDLTFRLPPGKGREIYLTFGLGEWTPAYINTFMKYLAEVHVTSGHQSINLDSDQTIKDYFLAHRKKRGTVIEFAVQ